MVNGSKKIEILEWGYPPGLSTRKTENFEKKYFLSQSGWNETIFEVKKK